MEEIEQRLRENDITSVRFEVSDTYGIPHGQCIAANYFKMMAEGGVSYSMGFLTLDPRGRPVPNTRYGEEITWKDCQLFPDLDTFQILPWCTKTARVLAEGVFDGEKVAAYPRVVARKQLDRLREKGFSLLSAHEYEFYLYKRENTEPLNAVTNSSSILPLLDYESFFQQVLVDLPKVGVNIEKYQCESGVGQLEITYRPAFGINAADNAHTYKLGIKEIALKHGYIATFMSKIHPNKSGSSAHYCHSLWDVEGKVGQLYDAQSLSGLSKVGEHWVAGLLTHARAIAILMAPTVNCLKRFKKNSFAPWNVTWGQDNRTCAIRTKVNGESGTYIENRLAASGCSPYISMAGTIAAGLDGISKELPLPKGFDGLNAYEEADIPPGTELLPTNMEDAIEALLADDVITTALGPEFITCFVALKRHEIKMAKEAMEKGNYDEWERDYLMFLI